MKREILHKVILSGDSRERFTLPVCLFLLFVFLAAPASAVIPNAGSVITSQSEASYRLNGNDLAAYSNTVTLSVLPVFGPMILPDGSTETPALTGSAFSGETVSFHYTLENTGNEDDTFELSSFPVSPSDFVPSDMAVYLDQDGDGFIDPGEEIVTLVGPLIPGETASLVLSARLPPGLTGGEIAHIDLTARSMSDTSLVDSGNIARVIARDEASVSLIIESDRAEVMPGEILIYTIRYSNPGERAATDVVVTDFVDYSGMSDGTEFVAGSVIASFPGQVEYFDIDVFDWVEVAPPAERIKGVRQYIETLTAGADGYLSFAVRIDAGHGTGSIFNTAAASYTGGDAQPYSLSSNEIEVHVGAVSALLIGPRGDPAGQGSAGDRVVLTLSGSDTTCTFWHEILNAGNYTDTVQIILADSTAIPAGWDVEFVNESGVPFGHYSPFIAGIGALRQGDAVIAGLRIRSTPESFRAFDGREFEFILHARSLVDNQSWDPVSDVLVKADIPLLSVKQSIREPNAMTGDILSYIVTIENLTEETTVDSILLVESLAPGLGFAGGSDKPRISGNTLQWDIGTLGPGEKRQVIYRAVVKAGQERGELVSRAWVYGISSLGEKTSDGPAVASIRIIEGIFSRKGILFGSVFFDEDGNGIRGRGEGGVIGVSVFLENGTYAVTDSTGLYSIPGTVEGTHVLRIDPKTLPDSLEAGKAGYFGLGVAGEYLVELAPSGNRRVDFPLQFSVGKLSRDTSAAIRGKAAVPARSGDISSAGVVRMESGPGQPGKGLSGRPGAAVDKTDRSDSIGTGEDESETTLSGDEDLDGYKALTIPSTHFGPGSAILQEIPIREVAMLSLWIMENPGWKVVITGHTDNIPINTMEFPSNFELSLYRARSVFQLLRMNGIPEKKMDYTGVGSRFPIASNNTKEGRSLNRRVTIKIIPPEDYASGDPNLPEVLSMPDTTEKKFSLADDAGICSRIVMPEEGHVFTLRDKIDIEVISPLTASVELYVNNIPVGREKLGQKRTDTRANTLGVIFCDVRIDVGRNDILVVCRNRGERNVCVRHVYLVGNPAGIVAEREAVSVPADGKSSPEILFLVNDRNGLPVRDGIFVTVTGPKDLLGGLDVNPHQSGTQLATRDGKIELHLPPSRNPMRERITVDLNGLTSICRVAYESPMREWFLFGYGEAAAGYSDLTGAGPVRRSGEKHYDGLFAEGKISLYGQGEVSDGHLMTIAVDTRPYREDKLLGRIEPEKHYPVYGDASDLKFNSASRSGTYLRLDHRRYNAMFGDFQTDLGEMEFTKYNRTFNGIKGEARFSRTNLKSFITRTDQVTYQEDMPADGTSGFYFLKHFPLIEHSEKIRVEIRDRYRTENIIRVDDKQYGRDYDINYLDGSILFKEPVAAHDENLNPVTIVVSYECRDSGEVNFIYGVRSSFEVTDSLRVGATVIIEEEGAGSSSIMGVDLSGHIYRGLSIETEYARSDKFLLGDGEAFRLKLMGRHGSKIKWNTYYRDIDAGFFNPGFTGGKTELGSRKLGMDLGWMINSRYAIATKAFSHFFRERNEEKKYFDLCGLYKSGWLTGRAGLGAASYSVTDSGSHSAAMILGAVGFEKGPVKGELQFDQIIAGEEVEEYPNRIQASLSRRFWKNISGTLKHEYRTGTRTGTRHLTQLGLESRVSENLNLYSRYRMEGAMSGERGQAVMGLKNRFRVNDALTSTFTAEKLATVSGMAGDDYTAFSTGWLYTPGKSLYKIKGNYEIRIESDRCKHLVGLAGLKRLSRCWSGLLKGDMWYSNEYDGFDRVKGSSVLGTSFRPLEAGPLTVFSLMKTNYEKNSPAHPGAVDKDLMIMTEAGYKLGSLWEVEGKIAGRWVRNTFKAYTVGTSSFLYQAQVIRTFRGEWDISLAARIVQQRETATLRYGGGLELGKIVAKNIWVGCGYDFGGHRDADAGINDFERNGFHIGMKMKFNERILDYFHAGR